MSNFYDQLSPFYHVIFENWDASIERQGSNLKRIIQSNWPEHQTVLDVSCGIGTQAIGLSRNGYQVTASDLSANEVERAKHEAQRHGQTNISFSVCDMRTAFAHHGGPFDIVISCDNSIPHLLTDDDILSTLKQMYSCLRPGGGCLITIRDYDQEQRGGKNLIKPYGKAKIENGKRYVPLQVWDFDESDDQYYDFTLHLIEEDLNSKEIITHAMRSRYYAIQSEKLIKLMHDAGFEKITRLNEGFYQPVYIGTRPSN
jgi:SAM-dependent methyltransferase